MIEVYFVTQEQYDLYDKMLPAGERFTDSRLADLGVRNIEMKAGKATLVATTGTPDKELPAKFYHVVENCGHNPKRHHKCWKAKDDAGGRIE